MIAYQSIAYESIAILGSWEVVRNLSYKAGVFLWQRHLIMGLSAINARGAVLTLVCIMFNIYSNEIKVRINKIEKW